MSHWVPPSTAYQGFQVKTLYLPHGKSRILQARDFVTSIVKHEIVQDRPDVMYVQQRNFAETEWIGPVFEDPTQPPHLDDLNSPQPQLAKLKRVGSMNLFLYDQFKILLSKKPIIFNVGTLTMENIHDLGMEFGKNYGSDSSSMVLEPLNKYLKLISIIDDESLRVFRTAHHEKAALVELNSSKWIVGKYDDDSQILDKMFAR